MVPSRSLKNLISFGAIDESDSDADDKKIGNPDENIGAERWLLHPSCRRTKNIITQRNAESDGCIPVGVGIGETKTLAKLATYDGVKQQLRRWCAAAPLAAGTRLVGPDGSKAGLITSSLELDDGSGIGLALIRRPALDQATLLAEESNPAEETNPAVANPALEATLSLPERFSAPSGSSVRA